jgi:hypothetical protein
MVHPNNSQVALSTFHWPDGREADARLGMRLSTARIRNEPCSLADELLPFTHPKLAVTAVVSDNDIATLLDRRLKRLEEMKAKAIEAKPVIDGEKVDARLPPRLPDRRFRRA